jgi:hypothetical protein
LGHRHILQLFEQVRETRATTATSLKPLPIQVETSTLINRMESSAMEYVPEYFTTVNVITYRRVELGAKISVTRSCAAKAGTSS